jgi:hypothetical protein
MIAGTSFFSLSLEQVGQTLSYSGGQIDPDITLGSLSNGLLVAWAETDPRGGQPLRVSRWNGTNWKFIEPPGCGSSSCLGTVESHPSIEVVEDVPYLSWRAKTTTSGKVFIAKLSSDPTWAVFPSLSFNVDSLNWQTGDCSLTVARTGELISAIQDDVQGDPVLRIFRWSGENWIGLNVVSSATSAKALTSEGRFLISYQNQGLLRLLDINTNKEEFSTQLDTPLWIARSSAQGDVSLFYINGIQNLSEEGILLRMNRK